MSVKFLLLGGGGVGGGGSAHFIFMGARIFLKMGLGRKLVLTPSGDPRRALKSRPWVV